MKSHLFFGLVVGLVTTLPTSHTLAQTPVQASDLVDMFEKLSGKYPGHRKAHARGLCAQGTFTPANPDAFKGAKLLSSGELPVSLRFSVGGGNPDADERTAGTRGAGIQIKLPDGSVHVFTGNNFPVFAGKNPDVFHGFLSTLLPDENGQRDPQKTATYIASHPSIQPHIAWQQSAKTAASYANTEFFGLHTFYFDRETDKPTKFRWHLEPNLGVETLSKEGVAEKPADFLNSRFSQQLAEKTISYTLRATLGEPQDSDIDPSNQWPKERPQVTLGVITVTQAGGEACKNVNFDPNMLSSGFTPSDDPVLKMRSAAYAISFGKRLSNQ
ncbi:catalase family peroxidase [Aliiglaciecola litoralis]|uniref:Catalase-related peroxidase n=1 Tax=Aliiglaciecola litoralis TaxID=582857 RepID=A0ABN1LQX6_9ALTE